MPKIVLDLSEEENNFFTSYLIQCLYFDSFLQPTKQDAKITGKFRNEVNKIKRGKNKK